MLLQDKFYREGKLLVCFVSTQIFKLKLKTGSFYIAKHRDVRERLKTLRISVYSYVFVDKYIKF